MEENEKFIGKNIRYKVLTQQILYLIKKADDFISIIKSFNNNEICHTKENLIILLNYKDDKTMENCITIAKNEYFKLISYLEGLNNNIMDGNSQKLKEYLNLKKKQCSLTIYRIITKLSQFLIDYNFIVKIVKNYLMNNKYSLMKDLKKLFVENILSQENANKIEKDLLNALENEITKFKNNNGIFES